MKKWFFLSVLFLIPVFLFSQKPGQTGTNMRLFENNRPLSIFDFQENNFEIPLESITGSPYLNEEFYSGKIFNEDENTGTFLIRYNIYNDVMEVKLDKNSIQELIIDPEIKVSIGTTRFRVHNYKDNYNNLVPGYFQIIEEGDKIDLLQKHHVTFSPAEPPKSGYHKPKKPEFEYSKEYYLYFNDGRKLEKIKKLNEKRLLGLLNDKAATKKLIRKNNLDLKTPEDLRKLIRELNSYPRKKG